MEESGLMKLKDINAGALNERFEEELAKVVENIHDPNSSPLAKRSITIKVSFTPDKNNIELATMVTSVESKLAPVTAQATTVMTGFNRKTGEMAVSEIVPRQHSLFPVDTIDAN